MKVISRNQALEQQLSYYFTGKPCKHGHVCKRYMSDRSCVTCNNDRKKKYYVENKETCSTRDRKWTKKSSENLRIANNKWLRKKVLHEPEYRAVMASRSAKYRAKKQQATPKWFLSEKEQIDKLYQKCNRRSKQTNIIHHVDHIIPLTHDRVCGLHCLANLQILTGAENDKKGNTFGGS